MRYPKVLLIGSHKIKIEYVKELEDSKGRQLNGEADHDKYLIQIRKGLCPQLKKDVFLHESLHLVGDIYELGLNERQISVLTSEIIALINRNKLGSL